MCKFWNWLFPKKEKPTFKHKSDLSEWTFEEVDLLKKINAWREMHNVPLLEDDKLNYEVALRRAVEISVLDTIDHKGFPKAVQVLTNAGLNQVGENLAFGYTQTQTVFDAWIGSKSHNENILKSDWLYTGICIFSSPLSSKNYYCQIFSK